MIMEKIDAIRPRFIEIMFEGNINSPYILSPLKCCEISLLIGFSFSIMCKASIIKKNYPFTAPEQHTAETAPPNKSVLCTM